MGNSSSKGIHRFSGSRFSNFVVVWDWDGIASAGGWEENRHTLNNFNYLPNLRGSFCTTSMS
jgi:hypothetical protein